MHAFPLMMVNGPVNQFSITVLAFSKSSLQYRQKELSIWKLKFQGIKEGTQSKIQCAGV
jgi:hypothetical protein